MLGFWLQLCHAPVTPSDAHHSEWWLASAVRQGEGHGVQMFIRACVLMLPVLQLNVALQRGSWTPLLCRRTHHLGNLDGQPQGASGGSELQLRKRKASTLDGADAAARPQADARESSTGLSKLPRQAVRLSSIYCRPHRLREVSNGHVRQPQRGACKISQSWLAFAMRRLQVTGGRIQPCSWELL